MILAQIKTIAEITVLLLAGGWAVFGFVVLRQREKAEADLKKIATETKKIEADLQKTASLNLSISASVARIDECGSFLLMAEVQITNNGRRDTRLKWKGESPAFTVRKVTFDGNGIPMYSDPPVTLAVRQAKNPNLDAVSHVIRAGGSQAITFAVLLPSAGVYFLSFRGVVPPDEQHVSFQTGVQQTSSLAWTTAKYIYIDTKGKCGNES